MNSGVPGDPIIEEMAKELHDVLVQRGMDPRNPPQGDDMPTQTFFAEYQRRGGTVYTDHKQAAISLVERVKSLAA